MRKFNSPEELAKALWNDKDRTVLATLRDLASRVPKEFRDEFILGMEEEIELLLPEAERYNYGKKLEVARRLWQLSGLNDPIEEASRDEARFGLTLTHATSHLFVMMGSVQLVCLACWSVLLTTSLVWKDRPNWLSVIEAGFVWLLFPFLLVASEWIVLLAYGRRRGDQAEEAED